LLQPLFILQTISFPPNSNYKPAYPSPLLTYLKACYKSHVKDTLNLSYITNRIIIAKPVLMNQGKKKKRKASPTVSPVIKLNKENRGAWVPQTDIIQQIESSTNRERAHTRTRSNSIPSLISLYAVCWLSFYNIHGSKF